MIMHGQLLPAFINALLDESVEPEQIERAVIRVGGLRLGQSIASNSLHRAFADEQAKLLERKLK